MGSIFCVAVYSVIYRCLWPGWPTRRGSAHSCRQTPDYRPVCLMSRVFMPWFAKRHQAEQIHLACLQVGRHSGRQIASQLSGQDGKRSNGLTIIVYHGGQEGQEGPWCGTWQSLRRRRILTLTWRWRLTETFTITQPSRQTVLTVAKENLVVFSASTFNLFADPAGRRLCDVSADLRQGFISVSASICCDSTLQFHAAARYFCRRRSR